MYIHTYFILLSVYALICVVTLHECVIPYASDDSDTYDDDSSYNSISNGYSSHDEEEHHQAEPYAFGYSVKDFKKGTNFNQHESSDGQTIKGQYAVALPDGRMQIVLYKADWKNGYHADVKYVGEAQHPQVYGSSYGVPDSGGSSGYEYLGH